MVIAGLNQETVTAAARRGDNFVYTVTRRGDGTVPTGSRCCPARGMYFTPVAHSELTRDTKVAHAVADLLHAGTTRRLSTRWRIASAVEARVSDPQLRRTQR